MNPFNLGEKLYRTGDLVKYRADGNIDFLGRIDLQVKVRGFRIELGEIENTLSKHPSVKEAVVVVKDDASADKRIVAYITTQNGQTVQAADLKNYLRDTLPEYMVPSTIVFLDEFPLSPSGKIDRKKLPAPEFSRTSITSEYKPPESELEIRLCKICSELLNIDRVGVSDNFFELGGHSLLATQFLSRIRDEFNVEIPVRFLFENPTVEGIASQINQLKKEEESDAERLARLFARINELSDEEVRALLEEKKAQASRRKVNE
jgi:acyl carrier protein